MKLVIKARKMPIGTVSRGYKKVAEGKWVAVGKGTAKRPREYSKKVANNVYASPKGESPSFASPSKDAVVAYVQKNTGDDVKRIESNLKKKSGWYIWTETEDIYYE